jgi:hypothetical protein
MGKKKQEKNRKKSGKRDIEAKPITRCANEQ